MTLEQENAWAKVTTGAGDGSFRLRAFWGEERMSGLFRFDLEMESLEQSIDLDKVVGAPAMVSVSLPKGAARHFHGLVTRIRQGPSEVAVTRYFAEVRPWLWLLTQTSTCQIFQDLSTPEIVEQVFEEHGQSDFRNELSGTYAKREYCVQYRETAFDFVCRLLEEEGICYFFEHSEGSHTLVLADEASAHQACPEISEVSFKGTSTDVQTLDMVSDWEVEKNVVTDSFSLNDYFFESPSTPLEAEAGAGELERYDYPGGFETKDDGDQIASLRLGVHQSSADVASGASFCPTFSAGYKFELKEHPRSDANGEYTLRSVEHQFTQELYRNRFVAGPADVTYRPPLSTARPIIAGSQTAQVVGKEGEEIWTDNFGRVKVLFHWDRLSAGDEKSSCWIRVSQGWAGKNWGAFFLPRVGQEVVVSFLEGDPDRPLITGSVYNGEQLLPYDLPENQTQSTVKSNSSKGGEGFNEIRFEDKKDEEELFIHAQKDMTTEVLNDSSVTVLNDSTTTVTKNRTVTVSEGDEIHSVVEGTRTLDVKGDEQHTSQANFMHEVQGDFTLKVTGAVSIEAGGDISIKATGAIASEAGTALSSKAGTSLSNEAGTDLTNKAGTTMSNEAGVSLTNKGSASQTVDGGGMLTIKGGLVQVN